MPETRVVNTSPLVFVVRAGLLEMLQVGAREIVVPEPVIAELRAHGENDPTVTAVLAVEWLTVRPVATVPPAIAAWDLGPGESAVMAIALNTPGSRAVVDDRDARRCARSLSIPVIGTLGLVLLAKAEGRIPAARPIIERLRDSGMYLSDSVVNETLARVGE